MAERAERRRNSGGRFNGCSFGSIRFFLLELEWEILGKVRLFLGLGLSSFSLREDDADLDE